MVGIIDSRINVKLEQFLYRVWREDFMWTSIGQWGFTEEKFWRSILYCEGQGGNQRAIYWEGNFKKINVNFKRFFFAGKVQYFLNCFCSFFLFFGQIHTSYCDLSPVNPDSLAWCTGMLTTRFWDFWEFFCVQNESNVHDQREKLHFPTIFESI